MKNATPEQLIAFETHIKELWEAGELPYLLHLCGGNEVKLVDIFRSIKLGDWVFSTHRNHYHALLAGMAPDRLESLIREGKSMFVYDAALRFCCSAVLAGTAGIAAGVAWDIKASGGHDHVWCFVGDGAEEEGHFWEAAQFVEGHELPCTFIIEDNDRQVDTPKAERRGGQMGGLEDLFGCVRRYTYTARYPHAGSGCAHKITFKTLTPAQ